MSPTADPAPGDIHAAAGNPIEPAESRATTAPTVVDQQPSSASPMKSSMFFPRSVTVRVHCRKYTTPGHVDGGTC